MGHDEVRFMRTAADSPPINWGDLVAQAKDRPLSALASKEQAREEDRKAALQELSARTPSKTTGGTSSGSAGSPKQDIEVLAAQHGVKRKEGEAFSLFRKRVRTATFKAKQLEAAKLEDAGASTSSAPVQRAAPAAPAAAAQGQAADQAAGGRPPLPDVTITLPSQSITTLIDKQGGGAIEIFQLWHVQKIKDRTSREHPCAWKALAGKCRDSEDDKCVRLIYIYICT